MIPRVAIIFFRSRKPATTPLTPPQASPDCDSHTRNHKVTIGAADIIDFESPNPKQPVSQAEDCTCVSGLLSARSEARIFQSSLVDNIHGFATFRSGYHHTTVCARFLPKPLLCGIY